MIKSKLLNSITKESCAVIGNAPYSSDLSAQIDSFYVMRCNKFNIPERGLGTRTDLNISSLYNSDTRKLPYPVFGVLPISDSLYQLYTEGKQQHHVWIKNKITLTDNQNEVWTYDESDEFAEVFKRVAGEINAFPTTGLMGIVIARWIGFKQILLSGFTFNQTQQRHYGSDESRILAAHHNPVAEMRIVNKWINEDKIVYILDELTKQILDDNREN